MFDSKVTRGVSAGTLASFLIFSINYFELPHKEYWMGATPVLLSILLAVISLLEAKLGFKSESQHRLEARLNYLKESQTDPLLDETVKQENRVKYQETHAALDELLSNKVIVARRLPD